MRSIILTVVFRPTSEEMRIFSTSSRTSSSTVDLPTTALASLPRKLDFVFSSPLSRSSFFSLLKNLLKKLTVFGL